MATDTVRVAMLGAGFIGQMHSLALRMASYCREQPAIRADLALLVDRDERLLEEVARRYGWREAVPSFRPLSLDELDLYVNAAPNDAHLETTISAASAGIDVFCEKPLGRTAEEAFSLWKEVERTGVIHRCAFIHRFIPALVLAREIIGAGEIGEVIHFRSRFLLDMRDPEGRLSWRFDRARAGSGSLGDLGSHHIDVARFLVGEVEEVSGTISTWTRGTTDVPIVNDDAFACTAILAGGASATFEASRVAAGHELTGLIEVDGTEGSVAFDMQRLNELTIRRPRQGPRRYSAPGAGEPYDGFWLPGGIQGSHPIGWHQCFAHQSRDVMKLTSGEIKDSVAATFEDGYRVAEIADTIEKAAEAGSRLSVEFRG
jgi:predicted dehydrogenase